jgi:hypothetical protein
MSKADEAKRREARLAARLRDNLKRRRAGPKSTPDATKPPQPEGEPQSHTSDTTPRD